MSLTVKLESRGLTGTVREPGGPKNHKALEGREEADQHPVEAITGLGDALAGKLDKSHGENRENPHGVTAAQVGARPDTWIPTAVEVGARPDTWLPTAEEIGAAPAGCGYGDTLPLLYFNNDTDGKALEAALDQLLATMSNCQARQIAVSDYPHLSGSTYYGSVYRHTGDYAVVRMYSYDYGVTMVAKSKSGGVWSDWSWTNPPMVAGVGYATARRWNGKTLHTCLVDVGSLPSNASKTVTVTADRVTVVGLEGAAYTDTACTAFPVVRSGSMAAYAEIAIDGTGTRLTVQTLEDMTAYRGWFIVSYVKE